MTNENIHFFSFTFSDKKERKELKNQFKELKDNKELNPLINNNETAIQNKTLNNEEIIKQPLQTINQPAQNSFKTESTLNTPKKSNALVTIKSENGEQPNHKRDRKISNNSDPRVVVEKTNNNKSKSSNVRRSTTTNVIAGNVNSGLGSPKNFANDLPVDDDVWTRKKVKNATYYSTEIINDEDEDYDNKRSSIAKTNMELRHSFYSLNRANMQGDIQIPINIQGDNGNSSAYPDSRVAYRLASNEFLNFKN